MTTELTEAEQYGLAIKGFLGNIAYERELLKESVQKARKAGATIPQLIEWTGYSRRTIYYLLEKTKP